MGLRAHPHLSEPLENVYSIAYTSFMTRHINLKDLRPRLPAVMALVDKRLDRFIVTKRGKPVAVILSPDDYEGLLETLDILRDTALLKRLRVAERQVARGQTRSLDDIDRSLRRAL